MIRRRHRRHHDDLPAKAFGAAAFPGGRPAARYDDDGDEDDWNDADDLDHDDEDDHDEDDHGEEDLNEDELDF